MKNKYLIIDFDSTFVKVEALDKLAEISLSNNSSKNKLLRQIQEITNQGMNGEISFEDSLSRRLALFKTDKKKIDKLVKYLKKNITPSILSNKKFFEQYKNNIYLISGGFKEYIIPVVTGFKIDKDHILANEFIFNNRGKVIGFDKNNPMAKPQGKVNQIKALNLSGVIYIIGDGYTDYQIKEKDYADKFFYFGENIQRDKVVAKADYYLPNFDEFLYLMDFPRKISYPKNRIKVLLLENIDIQAAELFFQEGYEVESISPSLSEKELIQKIKEVSILGIRSKTQITEKVVKNAKRLLAIGAYCIGTNQIDLKACAKKGIVVFNAPYSNTRSVVELVIGEIIMLTRKIPQKNLLLSKGIWDKTVDGCFEIRGKKLGIIGYGNIGSQLSVLAENLGMEVYFYDIVEKLALGNAKKSSLHDLLRTCDMITVHVDGRKENLNLIGEKEFKMMKKGVIFLNLSRGFVVDLTSLEKHLRYGKIAAAAIDVFPKEPKNNKEKFSSNLHKLTNVILTPHIGGNTVEAQKRIGDFVSVKLIDFINTGDTTLCVNLPSLRLPVLKNAHRIIHIHQNIPGILAKINYLYAKDNINIKSQYLKTNEEIGYVVSDINKKHEELILQHLKTIDGTIKIRVLY